MYMLLEAGSADALERLIREKLARKERIMGFGHRVYMRRMDPRAQLLKETLRELVAAKGTGAELLEMCERGEAVMHAEKGLYPNLDYYAAPVYYLLDIPIELYTPTDLLCCPLGWAAGAHRRAACAESALPSARGVHRTSWTSRRGISDGVRSGPAGDCRLRPLRAH
jgi:citrate synthase